MCHGSGNVYLQKYSIAFMTYYSCLSRLVTSNVQPASFLSVLNHGWIGGGGWVQTARLLLGLAVESPWLALGWPFPNFPFLSFFAPMDLDNILLAM